MSCADLVSVLDQLPRARVLVLGDLILDRYTWGDAERISQEAPVITLRADHQEERLGGAANVANMLRALEAEVLCCGVVGDDADGTRLRQMLIDERIDDGLVVCDPQRPTTVKQRFIGRAAHRHPSQILRVDHELREPIHRGLEDELIKELTAIIADCDVVLISDYAKGVCTPSIVQAAIQSAKSAGVPVVGDPSRSNPYDCYRGATVITPNRLETENATGHRIAKPEDALPCGRQLCEQLNLEMALITLDSDGMALVHRDGSGAVFPTQVRSVYDITGAGDMVLAMVGLCLGAGVAPKDAVQLGNIAGALEVQKTGVAVVTRDEIRCELLAGRQPRARKLVTLEQAKTSIEEHRRRHEKIVFTNGCFDLLHAGHVASLQEAASLGDALVVGLNSDESIKGLKGPSRPIIGQADRAAVLAALECVDYIIIFDKDTPIDLIRELVPDVLVKGGTYAPEEIAGHDVVTQNGGVVHLVDIVEGISTSQILASMLPQSSQQSRAA